MGKDTSIAWCHHTFNPWWGCQRVSPGCEKCYAEAFAHRLGRELWGPMAPRTPASESYWKQPHKWDAEAAAAGERHRVFCASMADVFEARADLDEHRARLWKLIEETPHLDWLLLTKRPQNMLALAPERWARRWPANVWAGATTEDRKRLIERRRHLVDVPAVVRFLSAEPLLEDLGPFDHIGIDWVIVGGESGPGARPFELWWARAIIDRCRSLGVAPFMKQLGSNPGGLTVALRGKCDDPAGWPEELRVQEFPSAKGACP